jgi:inorganic pyrophosphatase
VYANDPRYKEFKDVKDIPNHIIIEIKHFFDTYKELQGKKCQTLEILGRKVALEDIKRGHENYQKKHKN